MEAFVEARQTGLVRFLGFSAHHEEAAARMLERFPFDSVLFPVNYVCWAQGGFGSRLLAEAKRRGAARLALKAIAKAKRSPGGSKKHGKCWYEPFGSDSPTERARAALALRFTLSEDVTATVPPGDEELYRMCLDIAAEFKPLSARERSGLLRSSAGLEPIFRS
jgi:predicted aldo/keto reductase-like oxidoreductase